MVSSKNYYGGKEREVMLQEWGGGGGSVDVSKWEKVGTGAVNIRGEPHNVWVKKGSGLSNVKEAIKEYKKEPSRLYKITPGEEENVEKVRKVQVYPGDVIKTKEGKKKTVQEKGFVTVRKVVSRERERVGSLPAPSDPDIKKERRIRKVEQKLREGREKLTQQGEEEKSVEYDFLKGDKKGLDLGADEEFTPAPSETYYGQKSKPYNILSPTEGVESFGKGVKKKLGEGINVPLIRVVKKGYVPKPGQEPGVVRDVPREFTEPLRIPTGVVLEDEEAYETEITRTNVPKPGYAELTGIGAENIQKVKGKVQPEETITGGLGKTSVQTVGGAIIGEWIGFQAGAPGTRFTTPTITETGATSKFKEVDEGLAIGRVKTKVDLMEEGSKLRTADIMIGQSDDTFAYLGSSGKRGVKELGYSDELLAGVGRFRTDKNVILGDYAEDIVSVGGRVGVDDLDDVSKMIQTGKSIGYKPKSSTSIISETGEEIGKIPGKPSPGIGVTQVDIVKESGETIPGSVVYEYSPSDVLEIGDDFNVRGVGRTDVENLLGGEVTQEVTEGTVKSVVGDVFSKEVKTVEQGLSTSFQDIFEAGVKGAGAIGGVSDLGGTREEKETSRTKGRKGKAGTRETITNTVLGSDDEIIRRTGGVDFEPVRTRRTEIKSSVKTPTPISGFDLGASTQQVKKPIQEEDTRSLILGEEKPGTRPKTRTGTKPGFNTSEVTKNILGIRTGLDFGVRTKNLTDVETDVMTAPPSVNVITGGEVSDERNLILGGLPKKGDEEKDRVKKRKGLETKGYVPDFQSMILGRVGERPESTLTGFETRPIVNPIGRGKGVKSNEEEVKKVFR